MELRKPFLFAFAVTLGLFGATAALAWTGPAASPPGANASAPLNTSATGQVKVGGLQLNTGGAATGLLVGGNVGIGTNSPLNTLDLGGGTGGRGITWGNGGSGSYSNIFTAYSAGGLVLAEGLTGSASSDTYVSSYGSPMARAGIRLNGFGSDAGTIQFFTSPASTVAVGSTVTPTEGMRINSSGQVVIGSTVPYAGGARLTLESKNPAQWTQIVNYNNGSPSGQYGIYAYGSSYAIYGQGPIYSNASFTGPAFYYNSDERLKKNIQAIASSTALQKVLALEPVTYDWKDPASGAGTQLGFIAQQVEKVVPELVTTDASTTMKAVDYAKVTPLLVGAAQAQEAKIEALQKQVSALVAEVKALKEGK